MANRSILKVPDTRLRNKSTAVQSFGKDLLLLVQDLIDTTNANQGAGVAAPQIGVHKRVAVLKCSVFECGNPDPFDENENSDFWVLVNPELELSEELEQWEEGCRHWCFRLWRYSISKASKGSSPISHIFLRRRKKFW